jgi:hypothetical protein
VNINIPQQVKLGGRFRLQVKNKEGKVTKDTGWFDNLITNQGLDWLGTASPNYNVSYGQQIICTHCGVGTGSTAPANTDTALTSFLAMYPASSSSNVEGFSTSTYVAGPPAYWSGVFVYNFAVGAVVGNISEVGCGNTASSDTQPQLFNHALIVDSLGDPTTISLTSSDALVVNYELRMYLDLTDNTYSMVIAGVTYGGTYRRSNVTSVPPFYLTTSYDINGAPYAANLVVYNGSITSVTTASPTGSSDGGGGSFGTSFGTYTSGSYYTAVTNSMPLGNGNLSGGITAIQTISQHGSYQFAVSPAFPKTALYTATITWTISWARYP